MQSSTASRIVLLSALGVFGLGFFKAEKEGSKPTARFLIGATVTFTLLSVLSDFEPELAGPLALAILTTDIFANGSDILTYINGEEGSGGGGSVSKPEKQQKQIAAPKNDVGQIPGMKSHTPSGKVNVTHQAGQVGAKG